MNALAAIDLNVSGFPQSWTHLPEQTIADLRNSIEIFKEVA